MTTVAKIVLAVAVAAVPAAAALDAPVAARRVGGVTLDHRDVPLRTVLDDLERGRPGVNIRLRAASPGEEREFAASRVSVAISGVSWDTALRYLADSLRLHLDRRQEADGLVYLERIPRFSDTFNGVPLGAAVREIARRGGVSLVFSPAVDPTPPVYLSFGDVPWRDALDGILETHGCAVEEESGGRILRVVTLAEAAGRMETHLRPLRYARPDSPTRPEGFWADPLGLRGAPPAGSAADGALTVVSLLDGVRSAGGRVGYEPRTNSLVLTDTRAKIGEMLRLVEALDVPPGQVLLEMRIVTLDRASASYPEIRWDAESAWVGENGDGFANPAGRTGRMSREALAALEMAACADPGVNIVQAPEMLVLDGEEAAVFVGDLRSLASRRGRAPEPVGALAGTRMAVTPGVCRGTDRVLLELSPLQTGEPLVDRAGPGGQRLDLPARMSVKAARTKVLIRSSETAVITGLLDDADAGGVIRPAASRFSLAGDGGRRKPGVRRNTLILVTATIVPSSPVDAAGADETFAAAL